jgi:hypothetical protein
MLDIVLRYERLADLAEHRYAAYHGQSVSRSLAPNGQQLRRLRPTASEDQDDGAASMDSQYYHQAAAKLREVARRCRLPGARREILDLASRYDARADHFHVRNTIAPANSPLEQTARAERTFQSNGV